MSTPKSGSPYWLFVEGVDDECSIIHLLKRHNYDWDDECQVRPFVKRCGGINALLNDAIPAAVKTLRRIGIVIDADGDIASRWTQLKDRLKHYGVDLPDAPSSAGAVVTGTGKLERVGVWIMPDNSLPGTLEHFLTKLVPANDRVWDRARQATSQAIAVGAPLQRKDELKGTLHAWLAWQADPGVPFGTALKAQVFGCDSVEALRFVEWFRRLYC